MESEKGQKFKENNKYIIIPLPSKAWKIVDLKRNS